MVKIGKYLPIVILICVGLAFATADAQENLAQQVSAIFQQSCSNCHGPSGSFKEALLLDHTALIDTQVVIPGNPENSEFYKRLLGPTENGPQMPLNLPPLSPEAVETIARWITAGAPDWDVQHDINFITTDTILNTIQNHLKSLDPFDRPSARYFTMTHLYNAGETPETLSDYRIALSKLINSLSWKFEITNPIPIDEAQTIFHIDLRRYEWNNIGTDVWAQIEQAYPYNIAFDPETQAGLLEKLTHLQAETGSTVPFVHVDWFLATASLPPLYHDILGLPQTDRVLEAQLEVNVASNIRNAPGIDVWRAGFNDSGVSSNNRVVERHTSRYGAYWKSYDFAGSVGSQNIFTHPLDFTHDGGEIIFNLPNGLQAYLLVDANGNRLNDAPIDIVSNPAASDPTVRNGLSCIGCHTQGMKKFEDSVRAAIEQDDNPPYNKEQALRLYSEQPVLDNLVAKDTLRFQQALEKIGGPFADDASRQRFFKQHENEPIQRFHELFQAPLNASDAAAAVGLETEAFLTQIREKQSLKNLGLQTLIDENGTVKRDAWTSNFDDVISALNTPDSTLLPVVQRPERIPGAGVYIPDPNLREAIAEALGKGDTIVISITAEEMATLTSLVANNKGIQDLTGLEFAKNLTRLGIDGNPLSDLSPLASLTKLREVYFHHTEVADLSPLSGLRDLEVINASQTRITSLASLAGLKNLKKLDTVHSDITDLSPLAGLTNLTRLRLYDCKATDLSPLKDLTKLRWLGVPQTDNISDFSPLSGLTELRHLDLADTEISDLSALSGLINLETLILNANRIVDVSPLVSLFNLKNLQLHENNISNFSPLDRIRETIEVFTWFDNPGFPQGGPNIEGPWLWLTLPITDTTIDHLAKASNSKITEEQIATLGASEGTVIGESVWSVGTLEPYKANDRWSNRTNLRRLLDSQGTIEPNIYGQKFVVYGSITLYSPRTQQTKIFIGASNNQKVYLNGKLVHEDYTDYSHGAHNTGYRTFFPITLQKGKNVLLVRLDRLQAHYDLWSLFFGFESGTEYDLPQPVDIPDPNLRAVIEDALGKAPNAPITEAEMATLSEIDASRRDISDLTGLEAAKNLAVLHLKENPLSDLSPLTSLTKLHFILLHDTEVADLSPLASLTKLRDLGFPGTQVGDLSPLSGLHELEVLNASSERITSLAPLAGLKNLQELTVQSNITDLSPLSGLTNLTRLRLYGVRATNLSPLKDLTKLKWLGLTQSSNISDFSPLSGLTNLQHLDLAYTEISDVSPLSELVNLETLMLNANVIVDVSPLASLRNLKNLQLHRNNISDFSPLDRIRETIEVFTWFGNPGFPQGGPNIEGPWLWLTLPVDKDGPLTDYLAKASNSKMTEEQVATLGVSEGTVIGESVWLAGMLEPYNSNNSDSSKTNLRRLLDAQGAIEPNIYGQKFVVYGSLSVYAPKTQQTKVFIGASNDQKVYLNGKLVHEDDTNYAFGAHNVGYRTFSPITLQKGKNVLLVRLDGLKAHYDLWSLFFGFEPGTEYTVVNPRVGYTFSEPTIHIGDTFTLDLNAENIFDLAGWQFDIAFDPDVLEAIEVNEGDFLKAEGSTTFFQGGTIDNAIGKITKLSSARLGEDGVSGTGTLLSVTFTAKTTGQTQLKLENFQLAAITGVPIPAGPHEVIITVERQLATGDVNRDGQVSILDMVLVARQFGKTVPADSEIDLNSDGIVNIQDLIIVAQHLGESTTSAAPLIFAVDDIEGIDPTIIQEWIAQAQIENDGSIAFQQGIANLERLLALFIPEETALLHNYPNPFNPETWIPYQLSEPAEVTLTIHSVNGTLVRTLALGYQPAGIYQTRTRAVYWDGKNNVGESVASGVYFYTLTAGDFNATRKMLIRK